MGPGTPAGQGGDGGGQGIDRGSDLNAAMIHPGPGSLKQADGPLDDIFGQVHVDDHFPLGTAHPHRIALGEASFFSVQAVHLQGFGVKGLGPGQIGVLGVDPESGVGGNQSEGIIRFRPGDAAFRNRRKPGCGIGFRAYFDLAGRGGKGVFHGVSDVIAQPHPHMVLSLEDAGGFKRHRILDFGCCHKCFQPLFRGLVFGKSIAEPETL